MMASALRKTCELEKNLHHKTWVPLLSKCTVSCVPWTPPALTPEQSDVVLSVKPKSPCVCPSVSDLENVHDSEVNSTKAFF